MVKLARIEPLDVARGFAHLYVVLSIFWSVVVIANGSDTAPTAYGFWLGPLRLSFNVTISGIQSSAGSMLKFVCEEAVSCGITGAITGATIAFIFNWLGADLIDVRVQPKPAEPNSVGM
jgi:hypothetical protein